MAEAYLAEFRAREDTAVDYDQIYLDQNGFWHAWVEKQVVLGALALRPKDFVLDAGCGTGNFTVELARRTTGRVLAFDFSPRSVDIARQKTAQHKHVSVVCHDINLPAHYCLRYWQLDKILCCQVIQHLEDPESAVRLLYDYLRDGGTCVTTVYNADCFFLGKLLGRKLAKQGKFSNGIHYWRYTAEEIADIFYRRGFQKVEVHGCVNLDWYRLLGRSIFSWLLHPVAVLDIAISRLGISRRMGTYLIVRATR